MNSSQNLNLLKLDLLIYLTKKIPLVWYHQHIFKKDEDPIKLELVKKEDMMLKIRFCSLVLASSMFISSAASAACSFGVTGTRYYHRSAISYPSNCSGEARARVQDNLENILNVDYVMSSYSREQMESLTGRYSETTGASGSYSRGQSNSGSNFVRYRDNRWIVTVGSCNVESWSAAEGSDRGWGQGRANNGHCSADVRCDWDFTTFDMDCP